MYVSKLNVDDYAGLAASILSLLIPLVSLDNTRFSLLDLALVFATLAN